MKYRYWFQCMKGIGAVAAGNMLKRQITAEMLYHMTEPSLYSLDCFSKTQKQTILASRKQWNLEEELEKLLKKEISYVTMEEEQYPGRLRNYRDAPYGLFYKGSLPKEDVFTAAVVGARDCSTYGKAAAVTIGRELSMYGVHVVSGMARGIDGYAHQGALLGKGNTYGVLGCGVDVCYPQENFRLFMEIQKTGGILSEYPPGTKPLSAHFPMRNRIISGLSDVIIVVEAKEKSGSLITADLALEQGREVYAVPGQIDSILSAGCHRLIKQGAGIFLSVKELLLDRQIDLHLTGTMPDSVKFSLEKEERIVYSNIALRPKNIEIIQAESGLEVGKLRGILVSLQIKGYIEEVAKNQYVRCETEMN